MTVLITGASGYFAWEIIRQLENEGKHKIVAASSRPSNLLEDRVFDNVRVIHNDDISSELFDIDIIIHTAFCRQSIGHLLMDSLIFSKGLFEQAVDHDVKGIINVSSQSVYGTSERSLSDENGVCDPDYLYAFAKASSELLLDSIAGKKGSNTVYTSVRLASLVGPSKRIPINVLSKFAESAMAGKEISIQGGEQRFSFIDVRDAAEAIIRLLEIPLNRWDKIYNLGPEEQTDIIRLAEIAVQSAFELQGQRVDINVKKEDIQLNAGMDSSYIYDVLHWKPRYSLMETIIDTINSLS